MKNIYIFFVLLFFTNAILAQSNEGTNFWLGFMEFRNIEETNRVVIITAKQEAVGTVSMPLLDWSMPFSVSANEEVVVKIPASAETLGSEAITHTGIQISAQQPVSAYMHQYFGFSSEASAVFPTDVIDTEYFVMSYPGTQDGERVYPSEFIIVGTRDETQVTITSSTQTKGGRKSNLPFAITLNKGETYQVQAREVSGDLTGSHISSDKKIAVFGGTAWAVIPIDCGTRDNLLEQMHPTSAWGPEVLTIPSANVAFDIFRILAAEDNTIVEVQGTTTETYQLRKGEFIEYQQTTPTFIKGSKPILVAQYLIGQTCNDHEFGDPAMVLLNNTDQVRRGIRLFSAPFQDIQEHYINVITRTDDTGIIKFNGEKLVDKGVAFTAVGTKGHFSYARIEVDSGIHTITTEGCGIIASAYGYGAAESYAYSGDISIATLDINDLPDGGCLNDTVIFDPELSPVRFDFQWDLGDGTSSKAVKLTHLYDNLGTYPVELILEDKCFARKDTLNKDVFISLREAIEVTDIQVCEGASFQLKAKDIADAQYEWRGPENIFFTQQNPIISQASASMNGEYSVISNLAGCETFPAFLEVLVQPNPKPYLGEDTIVCSQLLDVVLDAGEYAGYRWQDNSANQQLLITENGDFWVEVTDEFGCVGADTVRLIQDCATVFYVPTIFSPNGDNVNDQFTILGGNVESMQLQIFNRWGALVFENNSQETGWDGLTFDQELAPTGVYIYRLDFEGFERDGSPFTGKKYGTVTLVR